ncbi:uncharacterized protein B0I36DRAFT_430817 [Microdochium trichocladiopsis]|uniref:Uncharacterized protein n=1 Tax=Microdochium trichocladiopsis TaxID=1682393 RepID=A0A9P9BVS9_9PEZI|nr:uncharacterized protein B0I36DRAFT_430817 [Microdochium trichocladiopsis]KAH7033642.1 hypothetical protein B0I36DRAFT_430817 [Microdochium trichocladiopsis]
MKTTSFLSVVFLAASAIAAPFQAETRDVDVSARSLEVASGAEVARSADVDFEKRQGSISDLTGLLGALNGAQGGAIGPLGSLQDIIASVQNGETTPDAGAAAAQPQLEEIEQVLQNLVLQLTGAAGLTVRPSDLKIVLTLVNTLLGQVLTTVNALVLVLGLRPQLNSLLASVLGLVAKVLTLLIGLLAGLLPGLIAGLSPLLAGLGNGLLAPLLTPIIAALVPLQNPGLPVV